MIVHHLFVCQISTNTSLIIIITDHPHPNQQLVHHLVHHPFHWITRCHQLSIPCLAHHPVDQLLVPSRPTQPAVPPPLLISMVSLMCHIFCLFSLSLSLSILFDHVSFEPVKVPLVLSLIFHMVTRTWDECCCCCYIPPVAPLFCSSSTCDVLQKLLLQMKHELSLSPLHPVSHLIRVNNLIRLIDYIHFVQFMMIKYIMRHQNFSW